MDRIASNQFTSRVHKWERHRRRLKVKTKLYKTLHLLMKKFNEDYAKLYEVKYLRSSGKIAALQLRELLGDVYLGCAFNHPTLSVAHSGEALKTAEQWLKMIGTLNPEKSWIPHSIKRESRYLTEGICAGMSIDLAYRYLNLEPLSDILQSLEKGGRLEACAKHILLANLYEATPTTNPFAGFLTKLAQYQSFASENPFVNFPVDDLKTALGNLRHLTDPEKKAHIEQWTQETSDPERLNMLTFLNQLVRIQKAIEMGMNVETLKSHSNPELTTLILSLINPGLNPFELTIDLVANHQGLHLSYQVDKMGFSSLQKDDTAFLKNVHQLGDGCYLFHFQVDGGAHVFTLIREGSKDTIVDPNLMMLSSNDPKKTRELMQKVINAFPAPPSEDPNAVHHRIQVYKYEKNI